MANVASASALTCLHWNVLATGLAYMPAVPLLYHTPYNCCRSSFFLFGSLFLHFK